MNVEVNDLVCFDTEELATRCKPGYAMHGGAAVDMILAYAFGRPDRNATRKLSEKERAVGRPLDLADQAVRVSKN